MSVKNMQQFQRQFSETENRYLEGMDAEFTRKFFAFLESILDNMGCGIYVKDRKNNEILFKNSLYRECFERFQENKKEESGDLDSKKENQVYELFVEEESAWFTIRYTDITWVDGRTVSLCTAYDITEKKIYQQKIEKHANNDFLTGLYNRMRCEEDLKYYIELTLSHGGEGAVLFIDLDDFKHINDGLGHQYGDVLLKAISNSLQQIEDIESTCYRVGGDEFVIIISNNHFHKMDQILSEVLEIFSKPWFLKGAEYYCTMSMGVVRFPGDGTQVDDLIRKADIALFEAKRTGKNRVEYYNKGVSSLAVQRLDMEKNMRHATAEPGEEFVVYYQPLIDISKQGNSCSGAEALIRWNSANLGFIPPSEFIPLAEYLGLINPIGLFVLKQACKQCKYWNDMGHPGYKINVNLSVIQLLQNDMVETVEEVLNDTGLDPKNLTLEVTESLAINDMNYMKRILGKIKKLGVRVALDDFGTGYSSLNHIREMPIDIIKVDKCFVNDLGKDDYSEVFVKAVTDLANALKMNVCVEGVETKEQFQILDNMNVDMIQGYYFDAPMRLKEFEAKYL
ncbi:MAG: bifunctional diguanylate cyclase/phosphodiesterase [Lachnospiraceae bacterium]